MSVSAMVGKPQLMAPAALAAHSALTSPRAFTKAKTRSLLYCRIGLVIARLHATEGHGRAVGKTQSEDRGRNVRTERHQTSVPADLHARFDQLLGKGRARLVGAHEDVKVLLLIVFGDHLGDFRIGRRADDGGKTGGAAVHELDAALAHDGVVGSTEPDLAVLDIAIFAGQVEIGIFHVADGLDHFFGQNGGHTGIQQMPQIGHVDVALGLDVGRQKLLAAVAAPVRHRPASPP